MEIETVVADSAGGYGATGAVTEGDTAERTGSIVGVGIVASSALGQTVSIEEVSVDTGEAGG